MAEIDSLLQTVMFTIYGNQYESREEHLLLTMFQVYIEAFFSTFDLADDALVCSNLPIRQHPRVLLPSSRKHPRLSNDDDIYTKRSRTKLFQDCLGRQNQWVDRVEGS